MAEYRYDVACEDCLHNGVCCVQEHCVDVKQYIQTFGCCDFKAAADVVEVRHGEWRKTCVPDVFQCTVCKRPTKMDEFCDSEILRAYCPNCGAKMDGKGDGE